MAEQAVPASAWHAPDMIRAVRMRDVGAIYRILRRYGVSQRRIAALTGQSQSEISEIVKGRQVRSVDVLIRICDGLGIAHTDMGLGYMPDRVAAAAPTSPNTAIPAGCSRCAGQPAAEARLAMSNDEMQLLRKILVAGIRATAQRHGVTTAPILTEAIEWNGITSQLLRQAYRYSVREFAAKLGVTDRMISKWEAAGDLSNPRPHSQRLLDTMLERAPDDVRVRFFAAIRPAKEST